MTAEACWLLAITCVSVVMFLVVAIAVVAGLFDDREW